MAMFNNQRGMTIDIPLFFQGPLPAGQVPNTRAKWIEVVEDVTWFTWRNSWKFVLLKSLVHKRLSKVTIDLMMMYDDTRLYDDMFIRFYKIYDMYNDDWFIIFCL